MARVQLAPTCRRVTSALVVSSSAATSARSLAACASSSSARFCASAAAAAAALAASMLSRMLSTWGMGTGMAGAGASTQVSARYRIQSPVWRHCSAVVQEARAVRQSVRRLGITRRPDSAPLALPSPTAASFSVSTLRSTPRSCMSSSARFTASSRCAFAASSCTSKRAACAQEVHVSTRGKR